MDGKGQKASKLLAQELRDPEACGSGERSVALSVPMSPSHPFGARFFAATMSWTCQDLQIKVMVVGHVEYTSEC